MSKNIIRKDIVQVSVETDSSALNKLDAQLEALKKAITGDVNNALDSIKESITGIGKADGLNEAAEQAKKLGKTDTSKLQDGLKKVSNQLTTIAKKAAGAAFKALKKLASISFKALIGGVAAAAGGVVWLTKQSVNAYADYEQLVGGVDTLFKDSSGIVQKNANNAFKTAGLSANEYMSTVTSFSASLIQGLAGDTKTASEYAHLAIVDMADNANKMGTDMSTIQSAYQGFAKQNYTLLDNLKLGYGGTKTEMQRLVKDASKLDDSINANSLSFDNIVKAIHAVQENLDITGTTAKEAEHTITGSLNSLKSAWNNLMPALIKGGDAFDQCVDNLIDSFLIFKDNAAPAVEKALSGIGKLFERLAPDIEKGLPKLVDELLPGLLKAITALLKGAVKALPGVIKVVAAELPGILKQLGQAIYEAFGDQLPIIAKFGKFIEKNGDKILKFIPVIAGLVGALLLLSKVKSVVSGLSGIFGKASGAGGNSKGFFGGIFESLAKAKVTSILKGMLNLSIILGGMAILAAAIAVISPILSEIIRAAGIKTIIEAMGMMAAVGVVGTLLAKLAKTVGNIPVSTVVKGLANMAIMLAGMSVALLVIGGISLINFDFKRMLRLTALLGVLGLVGGACTIFAGIAGAIPIPVVLMGLANIALVLGGLTAVVVAFGALSKIEGLREFIETGGELLASLFEVIGKCVGAVIGGVGEQVSDSLPYIGENLSKFATSLEPMFKVFKGQDLSGAGNFLKMLGAFMLEMTGDNVINGLTSWWAGETNFVDLGRNLTDLAQGAKGFFTVVSALPERAFDNTTKFFNCLAEAKGLPAEGGVKSWFVGNINYSSLANGLGTLSSQKVVGFFKTVSALPEQAFTKTTSLFESLANVKGLPSEGGIKNWFEGKIDWDGIATNLPKIGEAAKSFFGSIAGISDFNKMGELFTALANLDNIAPKKGGVKQGWDEFWNGETESGMQSMATALANFAKNTKGFFDLLKGDTLEKLDRLWASLNNVSSISKTVAAAVSANIGSAVNDITALPEQIASGIEKAGVSLKDSLVSIWVEAAKAMSEPVNKIIDGANWILKEFGSDKKIVEWTPYARGTGGHKGGNALVNDGRGAELVQMPNGNSFIPTGRNVFIPNAPKGMKVLSAERTARLLGKKSPTFNYANGTGDIDIWSYLDDSKGLVSAIKDKFVTYNGLSGYVRNASEAMVNTISSAMSPWVDTMISEIGSIGNYDSSKGTEQWRKTVIAALKMENQYSVGNVLRTLYQMKTESGGNPKAINLWDSNAKKGIPSKGLMQVIDPTFKAYARPGFDKNIYDPLSNILASIRYARSRYGSLEKAYQGHGYANGVGRVTIPEQRTVYTPESDYSVRSHTSTEYNNYSPQFHITISGSNDDRALARKIKRFVQEGINECFDSISRQSPKVREV